MRMSGTTLLAAAALFYALPAQAQSNIDYGPSMTGPGTTGPGIGGGAGTNEPGNPNASPLQGHDPDPTYRADPYARSDLPERRKPQEPSAGTPAPGNTNAVTPQTPPSP